jgi:hypothetical protein
MKRLLKSSGFWNAVIATILMGVACYLEGCSEIVQYIFFLFAGKTAVTGLKDFTRAQKGVVYDEKEKQFKRL